MKPAPPVTRKLNDERGFEWKGVSYIDAISIAAQMTKEFSSFHKDIHIETIIE